jgi:AraC-like DNA-binding protein
MRVSPLNLKILAYTLDVEGHRSESVLRRCGLGTLDQIDEEGEWVPVQLFDQMMAVALEETGDPAFSLVAGKSLALMRYGHMVPLVISAPSLRQVLVDLERFAPLVLEFSELELSETAKGTRIVMRPAVGCGGLSGRFRTEFLAVTAVQLLRFSGADNRDIHRIDFAYPCPPGLAARYSAAFGENAFFSQNECALTFNPQLLDRPLVSHDAVAYTAARTRAESALAALQSRSDTAERVRAWLLSAFPRQPSMAETAQHLGMTERTLRRHLSLLNTSHIEVAQDCQRLMAERLLAEGALSIKQVADELGFASVSTFHRAFRRWTGSTPATWQGTRKTAMR